MTTAVIKLLSSRQSYRRSFCCDLQSAQHNAGGKLRIRRRARSWLRARVDERGDDGDRRATGRREVCRSLADPT